ncbi:MAG: hypothetical protein Q4E17_01025 [Synergistes sp.]|nr:hypothetical protein [Synergistes sp.]
MKYKKYFYTILLFPVIFFGTIIALDPFHVLYNSPILATKGLEMRYSALAAINDPKFDSYILGTSMMENSSAIETNKIFKHCKFANISISGGKIFERSFVLRYLLAHKKVKAIIYSLDSHYLKQDIVNKGVNLSDYQYLYDDNIANNVKIYFSRSALKTIIKNVMYHNEYKQDIAYHEYNCPSRWSDVQDHMMRFGGLQKWFDAKNNGQIIEAFRDITHATKSIQENKRIEYDAAKMAKLISAAKKYCNDYFINIVRDNPETKFYAVFPPYSRICYGIWYQYDIPSSIIHREIVRYFALKSQTLHNLYVYGFEDLAFPDDISLYKDTSHYHPSINTLITKSLADSDRLLTADNVDRYLNRSRERAEKFDLVGLGNKISNYLRLIEQSEISH